MAPRPKARAEPRTPHATRIMKTARFADVVARCGAPEPYQLWMPAAKDPVFQKAVKAQRVLTVHQENVGTKKDYATVGFHEEPLAQFLVFPKSLRAFAGRRIIGINYDLLTPSQRPQKAPSAQSAPRAKPPAARAATARPPKGDAVPRPTAKASSVPARQRDERAGEVVEFEDPSIKQSIPSASGATEAKKAATEEAPKETKTIEQRRSSGAKKPARTSSGPTPRVEAGSLSRAQLQRELTRAMKELKVGKAVAAYERLGALLGAIKT